jgi:hypothetical protein
LKEEVIKDNEEEKVLLDDEFYLDEISYIFGTINNKSRYITFLGFKCISGKIAFVGEPDGDGFLFGKLGKKLQNMIIQMTEKGINKIEPEFKKIPKNNYFLRKLIKKIPNHIEEDEEIQDKEKLENLDSEKNINDNCGPNQESEDNLVQKMMLHSSKLSRNKNSIYNQFFTSNDINNNNQNLFKTSNNMIFNKELTNTLDKTNHFSCLGNNRELRESSNKYNYLKTNKNFGLNKPSSKIIDISLNKNNPFARSAKNIYSLNKNGNKPVTPITPSSNYTDYIDLSNKKKINNNERLKSIISGNKDKN